MRIGVVVPAVLSLITGSIPWSATVTASITPRPAAVVGHPHSVLVVSQGLKLSLTVSKSTYPRDALIQVVITLQNVSRHPIALGATAAPECDWTGPGVQVVDGGGQVLYPPATAWLLGSCGKKIFPVPLRSGGELRRKTFAILRAADIQAVATVGTGAMVVTPMLRLRLISRPSPQLTLSTYPVRIAVLPGAGWDDRFYFLYSIHCPGTPGMSKGVPRWERGSTGGDGVFRLSADCSSPVRWAFVGGWLDHPVATLNYPDG